MDVAVVILNWNGKDLLEEFLPSIVRFSKEATVYVADNASTDESVAFISENFPTVNIIENTTNGGYSQGYNDALKDLNEELFVLVNSDVEVTENWLPPVINKFESHPKIVAAQPKILDYNNKAFFEYAGAAGGFIDRFGYPYCQGRIFNTIEEDKGQYDEDRTIFWATGACLFVRKKAFWEVGGFDTDFFAHQEEIDLCWRLQGKGGEIKYIYSSSIYHVGGATLAAAHPRKTFYNFRNTLLMLIKNAKGPGVWVVILMRLLLDGIAGIQFIFQGKFKHTVAIIRAHFSFYRLFPKFLKKRKTYASHRKYFSVKSIVWQYFINKNRKFKEL
jgi:GT2 family glycosyltransferase